MLLHHSTDQPGKTGIEMQGFGVSHVEAWPDASWFCAHKDALIGAGVGWSVIVDIPDEVAAAHQVVSFHLSPPDFQLADVECFWIPWDIVNFSRPSRYERHAS